MNHLGYGTVSVVYLPTPMTSEAGLALANMMYLKWCSWKALVPSEPNLAVGLALSTMAIRRLTACAAVCAAPYAATVWNCLRTQERRTRCCANVVGLEYYLLVVAVDRMREQTVQQVPEHYSRSLLQPHNVMANTSLSAYRALTLGPQGTRHIVPVPVLESDLESVKHSYGWTGKMPRVSDASVASLVVVADRTETASNCLHCCYCRLNGISVAVGVADCSAAYCFAAHHQRVLSRWKARRVSLESSAKPVLLS